MPFALLLFGLLLVIAGARGKTPDLGALLVSDFSGAGNFFYWFAAIGCTGALGYYPPIKQPSRMFLALILIVMFLANKGVFAQLQSELANIKAPTPASEAAVGAQTSDVAPTSASTDPFGASGAIASAVGSVVTAAGGNGAAVTSAMTGAASAANSVVGAVTNPLGIVSGAKNAVFGLVGNQIGLSGVSSASDLLKKWGF